MTPYPNPCNLDTDYLIFSPASHELLLLRRGPGLLDWGYALFIGKADDTLMRQVLIKEVPDTSRRSTDQQWATEDGELLIGAPYRPPFRWDITWKGKVCWLVNANHYIFEQVEDTYRLRLKTIDDLAAEQALSKEV